MSENMGDAQGQSNHSQTFDSVTRFNVKFDAGDTSRSKVLYGNGRMQVKVQVVVSGADINGNAVHVPSEVMNSIELIHYGTGKRLRDGWSANTEQGRFTLEAQTSFAPMVASDDDADEDAVHPQVRSFWVSSATPGTTQIAARLTLGGITIRSNGSSLSSVHDSSVTLEAQQPLAYSIEQFRWVPVRRGNEEPGNRIWNHYLGLYPQGQQTRLVDWIADGVADDGYFVSGNKLREKQTNYLEGILIRPEKSEVAVSLPYNGSVLAYRHYADAITSDSKYYKVRVNDRDGELTVVQAMSEYSTLSPASRQGGVFHFRAIDQYGTEHKLAIHTVFSRLTLTVERG
ncbi:hypothetical protein [Pseudomonas sp. NPDC087639]|uniref:hypothetical protein n=1 Tax=Pseudomonas sp. NPDC087639 TaxID=3364445 RepID=UPI003824BD3D